MAGKRYKVHAECPTCGCVSVEQMSMEEIKEKSGGDEKELTLVCPTCGKEHKAHVEEEA